MSTLDAVGERLRRPEYTGENRCVPCTVVNVVIALGLSAVVGAVAPPAGVAVLLLGLAAIYFRGYLVPGTPTLTARYLPAPVFELLGKELILADALDPLEGTAVRATPEGGRLVGSFGAAWREQIAAMRAEGVDEADVATLLGVEAVSTVPGGETAYVVDNGLRQWLSESALIADAAAGAVLAERGDERWTALDPDERVETLRTLRAFLDRCPLCDGPMEADETETIETCCSDAERVLMATCAGCDTRLLENKGAEEALAV